MYHNCKVGNEMISGEYFGLSLEFEYMVFISRVSVYCYKLDIVEHIAQQRTSPGYLKKEESSA